MKRISESDARIDLVRYGRRLVQAELVQGTWGNLSVRLDNNYMLTTPSGLDYQLVKPADMVKVEAASRPRRRDSTGRSTSSGRTSAR